MTTALSRIVGAALALIALIPFAAAQTYPNRPITLIVPFAPGGPADVLGRVIGQKLSEDLGQQVVIDNRSGANTIVGAQAAARAKPDGYTLLLAIDGTLVMNPFLYGKLPYDPFKDFEPITLVAAVPSVITAAITTPVSTVKDIVDIEKAKPGTLQIGVSTPTSQVAIGLLNLRAGIKLTMVPYRGGTTQITSMLAGDIPIGHESVNVALPLYREKKIKIIALTGQKRLELAPEIPTIAETFPGFDMGIWQSVVAPARPRTS
jgi:tripartite-type tricarboxylate transporter receptor subunit TctC